MKNKIRILMVLGNTGRGGAQTFAMNVLRNINMNRFQIDFIVNKDYYYDGYGEEIRKYGSKVYLMPYFKIYNYIEYSKFWDKFLDLNKYDIIHGHVSSSAVVYLKIAKKKKCKTIVHSHSAGYRGTFFIKIIKKLFTIGAKKYADYWFACSELAAKRLFGARYKFNERYFFIPNSINVKEYMFDEKTRKKIRESLGISKDTFLYGHVGSFTEAKNHKFLIDTFVEILKIRNNSKLILLGDGPLREKVKSYICDKGILNDVILLGEVSNINEYLCAMDMMIFPSLFEGFPISVIESQSSGLYTIISDKITTEVCISDCVEVVPLSLSPEGWAKKTIENKLIDRTKYNNIISKTKFNMPNFINILEDIYIKIYNIK